MAIEDAYMLFSHLVRYKAKLLPAIPGETNFEFHQLLSFAKQGLSFRKIFRVGLQIKEK
jgi:hypothetical protein